MPLYDVALWRRWNRASYDGAPFLPAIVDDAVEADTPLLAALHVMDVHRIRYAAHVSVALGGVITRFDRLKIHSDSPDTVSPAGREVNR